jgi:hypothetical protein
VKLMRKMVQVAVSALHMPGRFRKREVPARERFLDWAQASAHVACSENIGCAHFAGNSSKCLLREAATAVP